MTDLKACLSGDKNAWDAFVAQAAPIIFAAVQRTIGQRKAGPGPGEVEDLAQDVFVRLIEKDYALLRSYDSARASLSTWLTLVARSTVLNRLRRGKVRSVPLDEAHEDALATRDDAPREAVQAPDGLLSPRQRLVLELLVERQMSVEQAAATLGVDAQTIRSTKHKAISRLREFFRGG